MSAPPSDTLAQRIDKLTSAGSAQASYVFEHRPEPFPDPACIDAFLILSIRGRRKVPAVEYKHHIKTASAPKKKLLHCVFILRRYNMIFTVLASDVFDLFSISAVWCTLA